jgi:hypothetical protein
MSDPMENSSSVAFLAVAMEMYLLSCYAVDNANVTI